MAKIIVGISVFCKECGSELRVADGADMNDDENFCPNCNDESETTVGISIHSTDIVALERTYEGLHQFKHIIVPLLEERTKEE